MIKKGICNTWEIFRWTCYISNRVFRRKIRLIKWRAGGCLCGIYFVLQINYTYIREEHIQRFWFLIIHAEITSWWNKSFILHDIDDIVPNLSGKILLLKFFKKIFLNLQISWLDMKMFILLGFYFLIKLEKYTSCWFLHKCCIIYWVNHLSG